VTIAGKTHGLVTESKSGRQAVLGRMVVDCTGAPCILAEESIAATQRSRKDTMSNEEIAVRLAAAILQPSVVLPARRSSVETSDEQIQLAAELAVHVYKTVLAVLQQPKSP
jgi:hypothetical protein